MATILEFRPTINLNVRKALSAKAMKPEASADIVIFPGVRIERPENSLSDSETDSKSTIRSSHNID